MESSRWVEKSTERPKGVDSHIILRMCVCVCIDLRAIFCGDIVILPIA